MDPAFFVFDLDEIDLLQPLDPALHLSRFRGLVAEALDESLSLLDLLLLILVRCELLFLSFLFFHHVEREVPGILGKMAEAELERPLRHVVQEAAVMRNDHHRAFVRTEIFLQPLE